MYGCAYDSKYNLSTLHSSRMIDRYDHAGVSDLMVRLIYNLAKGNVACFETLFVQRQKPG